MFLLLLAKLMSFKAMIWGAVLLFIGTAFLALLVIYLYNLIAEIISEILFWMLDKVQSVDIAGAEIGWHFSSGISYFWTQFRISECISIIVVMVTLKWTLRKIPFIRW